MKYTSKSSHKLRTICINVAVCEKCCLQDFKKCLIFCLNFTLSSWALGKHIELHIIYWYFAVNNMEQKNYLLHKIITHLIVYFRKR